MLKLLEVANFLIVINLTEKSGTIEKTEEKSLLAVDLLYSSAEEGVPAGFLLRL